MTVIVNNFQNNEFPVLIEQGITNKEIKLLIIDDSAFMRQIIKDSLSAYKNLKIDVATNGKVALQKIKENKPDVITLDIEMNIMNGIDFLKMMRDSNLKVPTIVLSKSVPKDKDVTFQAIKLGATDFISKPEDNFQSLELDKLGKQIFEKILLVIKENNIQTIITKTNYTNPRIIVIGASTGGPGALYEIFSKLPKINIPIIIVQHMPSGFTESLAKRLNDISPMNIKIAEHGEVIKSGTVYVAPGDYHLVINHNGIIHLNQEPSFKGVRPSVDITLKSVASVYGGKSLSIILTGMGNDGAEGVEEISKLGGKCIVQNKETCVVFGMPEAIIEDYNADSIVALNKIPDEILHYLNNWE